jgi:Periplasmic glucans biosynthesis protein
MNKPRTPHWTWSVLLALALTAGFCDAAHAFGFRDVEIQAEKLSGKPYQPVTQDVPTALGALDHAQYKSLRVRDDHRVWQGTPLPWEIAPLPPGGPYQQPVTINLVDAQGVHPLPFDPSSVDFGQLKLDPKKLKGLAWSGFDVLYPLNGKKSRSAALRFQAASFFSALGKGQVRGTFARGLSIDTGLLSGEAFPSFTTFWIKRPAPGQKDLVIDALLNSKNATGAFRFILRPGDTTTVDVEARIFLRDYVTKLGLAALTSMFDFGSNQPGPADDYRPQVHNADGLQIHSGTGEWIWRPLVNPKAPADYLLRHEQSAGLRTDAARARLRPVRGPAQALRPAAERLGHAQGRLGLGTRRAGGDSHAG